MTRRMVLALFMLINVLLALACVGPGVSDYAFDLSGGYQVFRSSAHQVRALPKNADGGSLQVPPKVIQVAWDESFILAKQQHLRRRFPDDPGRTDEEPAPGQYSYWILEVKEEALHGPFDVVAFEGKRTELGVPKGLVLRGVSQFAP